MVAKKQDGRLDEPLVTVIISDGLDAQLLVFILAAVEKCLA
jgi:hypothetical protein